MDGVESAVPESPESPPLQISTASLTSLRFFAAIYVVLFHVFQAPDISARSSSLQKFIATGWAGVPFFFILSGFVLMLNYGPKLPRFKPRDFYLARFARIYPTYFLAVAVASPIFLNRWHRGLLPNTSLIELPVTLLMVQNWLPQFMKPAVLTPAWTLSVELLFYLLFPVLILPASKIATRMVPAVILLLWFVSLSVDALGEQLAKVHMGAIAGDLATHYWPPFRLPDFLIGVFLARLYLARTAPTARRFLGDTICALSLLLVLLFIVLQPAIPLGFMEGLLLLPFGLLIYGLTTYPTALGTMLNRPILLLLGGASYALYLFHWPLLQYMGFMNPAKSHTWLAKLVAVIVVVLVSVVIFLKFEEPMRRSLRERFTSPGAGMA